MKFMDAVFEALPTLAGLGLAIASGFTGDLVLALAALVCLLTAAIAPLS